MQDIIMNQELAPLPDEDVFRQALLQIERFGKQTLDIAHRQQDLLKVEFERNAQESALLKKKIEEKESELVELKKNLIDTQMELSAVRRNENSLKLEVKQLQEQVSLYKVDGERIENAEQQLRVEKEENSQLKTRIEVLGAESLRMNRDHKSELDALTLKYEQEKIHLQENVQIAEDKARIASDQIERFKSLAAMAEKEKKTTEEELQHTFDEQKRQIEHLRSELAKREAVVSEHERLTSDMQSAFDRKLALIQSQTEQKYQTQIEKLKSTAEEQLHEITRSRYQLEQMKEDHRRTIEALKQDMGKQIALRSDEIRRQFMLKGQSSSAQT